MNLKQIAVAVIGTGVTFIMLLSAQAQNAAQSDGPQYTSDGQMVKPENYREWVYLTSGLGMNYGDPNPNPTGAPLFDNVFVNPSAYRAFLQTGTWPDKTVLVLELRASESKGSINKGGSYQTGVRAIEVNVKDEKRFATKWTFFGFNGAAKTAKQIPTTAACYTCHAQHGLVDSTFVQFYPTLLEVAKAKGTAK
jgi:hypothetical protein